MHNVFTTTDSPAALLEEIKRLTLENKKLTRQLNSNNLRMNRLRDDAVAQENVTAILSAEKSKQERHMSLLLKNCPDIIMLLDRQKRFVFCTDTFLAFVDIALFEEINSRSYWEVLPSTIDKETGDQFDNLLNIAMETGQTQEVRARFAPHEKDIVRDFTIWVTPYRDEDETFDGVLVVFHDMTELIRSWDQAEAANRAKSDFLATMSHEIRTPMNAIMGVAEILRKTPLDDKQRSFLQNIQNSSAVLLNIINDILDLSKIETGKMELIEEYYSLAEQLEKIKDIFEVMLEQKSLRFECRFAEDIPAVVYGDEKRVGQVLTNILNNAMKYTPSGTVVFSVYRDKDAICFEVKDSGIGIKQEDLERMFKPFEQLDLVKNKNIVGTGLGLAITQRLCEMMNGEIVVESEYGRGSCFSVRLHIKEGTQDDLDAVKAESMHFVAPAARVLVVDDIEINLVVAAAVLEDFGIKADVAARGKTALEMMARETYDIVFMDHMMPEMDGIETTLELRARGVGIPIIALTANALTGARDLFIQNGMNDFLSKPIDMDAMGACLLRWLPVDRIIISH